MKRRPAFGRSAHQYSPFLKTRKRENGWPRYHSKIDSEILELLKEGWTTVDIIAELGCSEAYIRTVRKRLK